jgi:excisionase family DNA binding protein
LFDWLRRQKEGAMTARLVSSEKNIKQFKDPEIDLLTLWLSTPLNDRDKQFMGTRTASRLVGVSQRTVRVWIETGCIQAVQIARKHRITAKSLEEFLIIRALQNK